VGKRDRRRRRLLEAERTNTETSQLLEQAVRTAVRPGDNEWCYVRDFTADWLVYELSSDSPDRTGQYRVTYSIADDGAVELGAPEKVRVKVDYEKVVESVERVPGRVLQAKESESGGRVFRVRILEYGTSRNRRRYTEAVMRKAAPLYEGAKAYDHHRTNEELATSTIAGLVGHFRNVEATDTGIDADLKLLPSATHVAEALDASLAAQAEGLPPLVGISHDVVARYKPVVEGGSRLLEATEIASVHSADVVADPAAGGRVTRMVAGGFGDDPITTIPEGNTMNLKQLLALLRKASAEERAELLKEHANLLEETGLSADDITKLVDVAATAETEAPATPPAATPAAAGDGTETDAPVEPVLVAKESVMGRLLINAAASQAKLSDVAAGVFAKQLPDRFTEAELERHVESAAAMAAEYERAGLTPRIQGGGVAVTKDERDKKVARVDAFFEGDFREGYRSFKEMFIDVMDYDVRKIHAMDGEDFNRVILRESLLGDGDSHLYDSARATESLEVASWAQILGDSITRRLVKEFSNANLSSWRSIVSDIVPVNDFRAQRIDRMGGYGVLPTVAERGPYQPLTPPGDEEATYSLSKKGGTEDLSLEMIANDDVRAIRRIPVKMGRAAAQTLYRFVWDLLASNPTLTYDSVALFHASHANTDSSAALAQSTLSVGRRKMREQSAYGDSSDILGLVPKILVVPPELEEIAFQLATSAVAIPASGNDTNIPNLHQGLQPIVIDYWTDANDWFLVADPAMAPTIEVGFYQGRQDPEIFVQDDPRVGSVFTADVITYKIRHIYSGAVVEHRSFYRGQG
jgi:hypothetical protein